ncbi:Poly(A) polymerase central domain-containing protein [Gongronella butleri]|nr:Poly(A) polymerase central domain-containing protein [Gongronella butleri]
MSGRTEQEWQAYLLRNEIIDNEDERVNRLQVVGLLKSLIPSFNRQCIQENMPKRTDFTCQLVPFGSYGLGSHIKGADIDLVLLAPVVVRRKDFFNFLPNLLRAQPTVDNAIDVITNANVPIIKCKIDGIQIDISFVRLGLPTVPPDINLLDNHLLERLEQSCRSSMDGPRVNQYTLEKVAKADRSSFLTALQAIKHWASQRLLYGKPMGYLNGSAWTLLLLRSYQLMRFGDTAQQSPVPDQSEPPIDCTLLLIDFFQRWANWQWPEPVMFSKMMPMASENDVPQRFQDTTEFMNDLMPIITPCYPASSAAPNVTNSTLNVIRNELFRAAAILTQPASPDVVKDRFFKPASFLGSYIHFIQVTVSSETLRSHGFWGRSMQYKLPRLVSLLEEVENIDWAQPLTTVHSAQLQYNTEYNKVLIKKGQEPIPDDVGLVVCPGTLLVSYFLIGLEISDEAKRQQAKINIAPAMDAFNNMINTGKRGKHDMDVNVHLSLVNRRAVDTIMKYPRNA